MESLLLFFFTPIKVSLEQGTSLDPLECGAGALSHKNVTRMAFLAIAGGHSCLELK